MRVISRGDLAGVATALSMLSSVGIACAPSPSVSEEAAAADSAEAEAMRRARVGAPSGRPYSEERASCAGRNPLRDAYWGELHVHTALSFDSYLWGVRGTPDDAYRFAKGEPTGFPPYHVNGNPLRKARLERPLDFAAVTDHASYMGEVALCTRPGSPLYDFEGCRVYRGEVPVAAGPFGEFAAKMGAIASSIDAHCGAIKTRRARGRRRVRPRGLGASARLRRPRLARRRPLRRRREGVARLHARGVAGSQGFGGAQLRPIERLRVYDVPRL